jgi:hypothetical protein
MEDWKARLRADPTDWLLEEDNPSVRYFTLRDILDRPENDPEARAAEQSVMQTGPVPEILEKQREPSYRQSFPRYYADKYEGLVWSLIVLAELGAEPVPQIREQCEYLLANAQDTQDGGFSQHTAAKTGGGRRSEVIPCLTGNLVWSLLRFGYLDDPRLQRGIGWLTQYTRFNDGAEDEPVPPPYDRLEMCWGRHSCHMGVVKALKALAAIPEDRRTPEVKETLAQSAEFLLIHHIHRRSHNLKRASKPGWLKFGFPLMYQTDALEILDILSGLGVKDSRMEEAADLMLSKQDDRGRWKTENTYNSDRLLVPFGQKGEPSKWLTLRALRILKNQAG